jgi:hypothetical protein
MRGRQTTLEASEESLGAGVASSSSGLQRDWPTGPSFAELAAKQGDTYTRFTLVSSEVLYITLVSSEVLYITLVSSEVFRKGRWPLQTREEGRPE